MILQKLEHRGDNLIDDVIKRMYRYFDVINYKSESIQVLLDNVYI